MQRSAISRPDLVSYDEARLAEACRRLGVRLAVLFGSRATGSPPPTAESDLDLAILLDPREAPPSFSTCYRELAPAFGGHALDLALLHQADPLFRHEVMCRGRLLYGDPDLFAEYRAFAYRDFVDSADLRALEDLLFRKKMAHLTALLHAAA